MLLVRGIGMKVLLVDSVPAYCSLQGEVHITDHVFARVEMNICKALTELRLDAESTVGSC